MPKGAPWVTNPLTGRDEPPELDWLIRRLGVLNSDEPELVIRHAYQIYGAHMQLRGRTDNVGLQITGTKRLHAKRATADRGVGDDLKRLLSVARGGSAIRWRGAWLGVSGKARAVVIRKFKATRFDQHKRRLDTTGMISYNGRGFSGVMPNPVQAIPFIEAALAELKSAPASERSKRRPDEIEESFVAAVCDAHRRLTHRDAYTWIDNDRRFDHGLTELCLDIDRKFQTELLNADRVKKIFAKLRNQDESPSK